MRWSSVVAALVLVSLVSANAAQIIKRSPLGPMVTAPMLLSACTHGDPGVHCDPYIAGVVDSITSNGGALEDNQICITPEGTVEKLRSLTVQYIQTHQDLPQNTIAASEVATAITEAFPCK